MSCSVVFESCQHVVLTGATLPCWCFSIKHDKLCFTGTSWDLNNAAVKQEHLRGLSDDSMSSRVSHVVFVLVLSRLHFTPCLRWGPELWELVSEDLGSWGTDRYCCMWIYYLIRYARVVWFHNLQPLKELDNEWSRSIGELCVRAALRHHGETASVTESLQQIQAVECILRYLL